MALKSQTHSNPSAIEGFESLGDRIVDWTHRHVWWVVAALVIVLSATGAYYTRSAYQHRHEEMASDGLDRVRSDFLREMGGQPGDIDIPELANPDAAAAIRSEFIEEFAAVASEHAGTTAAAFARLEQGNLLELVGDLEAALSIWRNTLEELADRPSIRGIFLQRIAQAYEEAERWGEAAETHRSAAAIHAYPLRYWALAAAARCFAQAGYPEQGRELALRLQAEAPELPLPEHLAAILLELRSASTR